MAGLDAPKPQCGSGNDEEAEYDLGLHVAGLFLVLAASCIGCGFPVAAKKIKWLNIPPKIFFVCKHFGTGVLIATAFVHLLPTAFASLSNPCLPNLFTDDYPPLPGVIMMGSLFVLFVIEMVLNAKSGSHSHGGPTGHQHELTPPPPAAPGRNYPRPPDPWNFDYPPDMKDPYDIREVRSTYDRHVAFSIYADTLNEKRGTLGSTMPPWFIVFYEQYVRQQNRILEMIKSRDSLTPAGEKDDRDVSVSEVYLDEENQVVYPQVYRKMSTNITLLEGGILFHSVFVGMTVSITIDGFIILLVAILFHQMFEGLGLGSRIAAVPYPKGSIRPWVLVVAFGTTAPIGLVTRNSYDPESAFGLIIVGVFNAISSGLLIYAALVDLLAEDFLSEEANRLMNGKKKSHAFGWVLAGAVGMSVVGAFA